MKSYYETLNKQQLINVCRTLDNFTIAYRNYILDNRYMSEPQLAAFDCKVCEEMARKESLFNGFTDEDWETISDLAYKDMLEIESIKKEWLKNNESI